MEQKPALPLPTSIFRQGNEVDLHLGNNRELTMAMEYLEPIVRAEVETDLAFRDGQSVAAPRILGISGKEGRGGWTHLVLTLQDSGAAIRFAEDLGRIFPACVG